MSSFLKKDFTNKFFCDILYTLIDDDFTEEWVFARSFLLCVKGGVFAWQSQ